MGRHVKKYVKLLAEESGVPEDIAKKFSRTPEGRLKERRRKRGGVRPAYPALTQDEKRDRLRRQMNCCAFCGRPFGVEVWWKGCLITLNVTWDHFLPYKKFRNHEKSNMVAACQVCNGIKRDRTFPDFAAARTFILQRWTRELERQTPKGHFVNT